MLPGFADFAQDNVTRRGGPNPGTRCSRLPSPWRKKKSTLPTKTGAGVDTNPSSNAGAIVLSGKDLDALPDDPDELQTDLEALAGPSAGPNGGQIYIDGFTAGQLPPKSSIREIRINQNPFSAEYDKLGYGRIEIFTKPGTDKYHGQVSVMGNSSAFNSQNPFLIGTEPSYHSLQYMGNVGGPLGKKASFFFRRAAPQHRRSHHHQCDRAELRSHLHRSSVVLGIPLHGRCSESAHPH